MSQSPRLEGMACPLPWWREGVLTQSRRQVELISRVDRVLETLTRETTGTSLVLSGQSGLLEDYLAVRPDHRARLAPLIRKGALAVGPWYLLPDEFLVSGEALARNLLLGHLTTSAFGKIPPARYLSDSFGHVAQIPQLLDLAGLDRFLFTRGGDPSTTGPGRVFPWTAPNGSRVLAVNPEPGTESAATDILDGSRARTLDPLTVDGPLFQGELLGDGALPLPSGVWSTRLYLKQANEVCQNLLCRYVEPLLATAHFLQGESWPGGLLDHAWRELLRNQARDSLCGVGTDSVHKDMDTRFAAVQQTSEQLLTRLMTQTPAPAATGAEAAHEQGILLSVANSLPVARDEVVERLVVLPPGRLDLDNLRLLDESGRQVPFRILERLFVTPLPDLDFTDELFCDDQWNRLSTYLDRCGDRLLGTIENQDTLDCYLSFQFLARNLPAVGQREYFLTDGISPAKPARPFSPITARPLEDTVVLENEQVTVTLHPDGTFDLKNKISGRCFDGLNLLEDTEDRGDEFDHAPAPVGGTFFSGGLEGRVRLLEQSDLLCRAQAHFKFVLPRSLDKDRHRRSQRTARCDVHVTVTLRVGSPLVEVETDFRNHAFDHRLRAWFPTGLQTTEVISQGQFLLNRRPLARPGSGPWPQQDFSLIQGVDEGLAVFNRGLPEFQTWAGPDGKAVFALTLLRCVDWLARDDLPVRRGAAPGPLLHTPDAQCYGQHTFRYAVAPFGPDFFAADIPGLSDRYRVPPVTHQDPTGRRPAEVTSLVKKANPRVALTALKKAEADDRLIVRLYNLDTVPATETLLWGLPVLEACQVDLREVNMVVDCTEPVIGKGGLRVDITLEAHQIITLALTFDQET